jgi:D-psicose/D-tagatose/L-ribulose 3-epimerase
MDWTAIMRALAQIGYAGPVSLEPFRRDDDRLALPIAHWRPPHENEDDKLRAGLALIRAALRFAEVNH